MTILTQNGKMRKSSQNGIDIFNFGIPAFISETGLKTCPNAGVCATGCYARSGTYRFRNTINAYEERLKLTQSKDFVEILKAEVSLKKIRSRSQSKTCLIRIHDSGDFYDVPYWNKWECIIKEHPDVRFYAYTKMVQMFKSHIDIPPNLTMIYSMGGKQDQLIDLQIDRHSRVFQNETDLLGAGYSDASQDDTVAALGPNPKIGLVYHGVKKYSNTKWGGSK
jgi:protein gp88